MCQDQLHKSYDCKQRGQDWISAAMASSLVAYELLVVWAEAPSPAPFSPWVLQLATGPLFMLFSLENAHLALLLVPISASETPLWQGCQDGPVRRNHRECSIHEGSQVLTLEIVIWRPGMGPGTWGQLTPAGTRSGTAAECCVPECILGSPCDSQLLYFSVPHSHGGRDSDFYVPRLSSCLDYGRLSVKKMLFKP